MNFPFHFDEEYLRLDRFAREYLTPIDRGGYTFSREKFMKSPDYYKAAASDLRSIIERMPVCTGSAYEGLALLIVAARQFGYSLAHRTADQVEALLRSALPILAGEPVPDFGATFLSCHARDGRDMARMVEGAPRVFH